MGTGPTAEILNALVGAAVPMILTFIVWVIRRFMKMSADIDHAFTKIRSLEGSKVCPNCSQRL